MGYRNCKLVSKRGRRRATFWASGSNAVFSATGLGATGDFTVTLAEDVVAANLTYTGGILNSTLKLAVGAGDTIFTGNPQMIVTVDFGTTLNIAPRIAGGGALTLQKRHLDPDRREHL